MQVHDYRDEQGDLRAAYGVAEVGRGQLIGTRLPAAEKYIGTSRYGRTWSEVKQDSRVDATPMEDPKTVN